MASDMVLYWGSGSPPCWRVMITLEEKGLQGYQSKLVSFEKKEHKSDEILKINPRGQAPTFKHGQVVVNESLAICQYLECAFKSQGTRLHPDDPAENAVVLQRLFEALNLHKVAQEELIRYVMRTKKEDQNPDLIVEKKTNCMKELGIWEGYIKETGAFIAGKSFTMADVIMIPMLGIMVRLGLNLDKSWPGLGAYYSRVIERPSVKASWPPHWKGTSGPQALADMQV